MTAPDSAAFEDAAQEHALPGPAGERTITDLHQSMTIRLTETSNGRLRVTASGEVDLGCAETLHRILQGSLRHSPGGLDLDLSDIHFFDCSGLNVLLRLRRTAGELCVPLRIVRPSAAVTRVVELTGTDVLLIEPAGADACLPL
jgi:anti-anti-sigma factor